MSRKGLELRPQLARYYESACEEVFGTPVEIKGFQYKKFQKAEKELIGMDIYPKDYAFGISKYLKSWVEGKGWSILPIDVFCGPWAIKLYSTEIAPIKFHETPTEEVERGSLLHDELLVARYYIDSSGEMSLDEVVEKLTPILGESWLDVFANNRRKEVVLEALRVLSMERGRKLESYDVAM